MIISKVNGNTIYKSWREHGKRKFEKVNFRPYFYVPSSAVEIPTYKASKTVERDIDYVTGDWVSLDNTPLKRVYVDLQEDMRGVQKLFEKRGVPTFEADVRLSFRYCIDEMDEMPEYNLRKWYWDMEWQQGGEHHDKITVIVVYDNYDKQYYQWVWFPDSNINERLYSEYNNHKVTLFQHDSEKEMLEDFMTTMITKDPDMLIAWFGNFADVPKLLDRACALGLNPLIMSPTGKIKDIVKTKDGYDWRSYKDKDKQKVYCKTKEDGYSQIEQPIGGRITLNLDLAFERQWNDSQRGTLPSLSLDYIGQTVLGKNKLVSEKFPDSNEFYRRAWLEDTQTYLDYALVDVELMVEIDETNFCSEAILSLQRLLKAPFDACFYASHMGSIYFMRNASWKAPTGNRDIERKDYEGAMIYDPLSEGTNGLHLNVAAFDFAGLYPSMMIARNISWETKSREPTEFGVDVSVPRNLQPLKDNHRPQMLYYKTDKLGLLPRAVLELKELRNEYKRLMREARDNNTGEFQKWNNNQMAVKRLMASFYGIVAFQGFGWADVDLAASITASAREAIRLAAFRAKELNI